MRRAEGIFGSIEQTMWAKGSRGTFHGEKSHFGLLSGRSEQADYLAEGSLEGTRSLKV
jgi:hypothetical protein